MPARQPLTADQAALIVVSMRALGKLSKGLFEIKRAKPGMSDDFHEQASDALPRIATLDEYSFPDQTYAARRGAHQFGQIIPGLRLIRDGMTHKRGLPMAVDTTNFFAPPNSGAVLYIASSGPVWVPLADLEEPPMDKRHQWYPQQRQVYADHLAGKSAQTSITRAYHWFVDEQELPGTIIHEAHNIKPGPAREYDRWSP